MPVDTTYEDDDEEQEGPRSSFGTYLAEGDALFKQGEYKKALESYSLALELQPNDKICLVARSKCYLKLGDPQKALQDAEDALAEDKEFNKGLYRKAEALYCMGDFEYALMYYHRGHKLRPELDEFRLGIQKAQEAIDNSIGGAAKIKLENKGDLSFFTKQDDMGGKKQRGGYLKPVGNTKKLKPLANRNKEVKTAAPSKKTVKQLLGELYSDKEYFEKLMEDEAFIKHPQNGQIYELVQGGLNYLETRTEFWRQQKPLYARKKDKPKFSNVGGKKSKQSVSKYILKQLQEVDQALTTGNPGRSLRLAETLLKSVEGINKDDLPSKQEVIANVHSCLGNAYIDLDRLPKALRHHEKDLQLSKASKSNDGISRSLDNIGRVHARMGNFKKAVTSWNEKLPLVKSSIESTWLCHEIGRCHLELGNYDDALEFGQKSLSAAKDCEDQIWQLNATVLIAQSNVKLGHIDDAMETFSNGLQVAASLEDESAQAAISKALAELQRRSSRGGDRLGSAQSEREASPTIQSDLDERHSSNSSRKQSPAISFSADEKHDDEKEVETYNDQAPEDTGADTAGETSEPEEKDTASEKNDDSEIHVTIPSVSEDDNTGADYTMSSDKPDAESESESLSTNAEMESIQDAETKENAKNTEAGGDDVIPKESAINTDMPLTSGDLDRQTSAEQLDSVATINTNADNSDHTIVDGGEDASTKDDTVPNVESIDNIASASVSDENFISPINTTNNVTMEAQEEEIVTVEVVNELESAPPLPSEDEPALDELSADGETAVKGDDNIDETEEVSEVSVANTSADINSEALEPDRPGSAVKEPETETVEDTVSQVSNIDDLPVDSTKDTPDVTTTETTDATTVGDESTTGKEGSDEVADGDEDTSAQITSQGTIDETTEEIPLDSTTAAAKDESTNDESTAQTDDGSGKDDSAASAEEASKDDSAASAEESSKETTSAEEASKDDSAASEETNKETGSAEEESKEETSVEESSKEATETSEEGSKQDSATADETSEETVTEGTVTAESAAENSKEDSSSNETATEENTASTDAAASENVVVEEGAGSDNEKAAPTESVSATTESVSAPAEAVTATTETLTDKSETTAPAETVTAPAEHITDPSNT